MISKTLLLSTLLFSSFSIYLLAQIPKFYLFINSVRKIIGYSNLMSENLAKMTFSGVLKILHDSMSEKTYFLLFDNTRFPQLIENIKNNIPSLANNSEFLHSIENLSFSEFMKTLDPETQYQIFKVYNDFLEKNNNLPISSENIANFQKSFKALADIHNSGIKTNLISYLEIYIIGAAIITLLATIFTIGTICLAINSINECCQKMDHSKILKNIKSFFTPNCCAK